MIDEAGPTDPSAPRAPVARRHVLWAAGALGGATAVVWSAAPAGATPTAVVWQLDPDWGYPRGPHGKTRLRSNAARQAAAHRYALTQADAEAMNLHKCSFAPPVAVPIDDESFATLWGSLSYDWTNPATGQVVRILDDRHVGRIPRGDELLAAALAGPAGGLPISTSAGTSAGAGAGATTEATGAAGSGGTNGSSGGAGLALTGSTTTTVAAAGASALVVGIAALRLRRVAVARDDTRGAP
jgi:hypothetical protein